MKVNLQRIYRESNDNFANPNVAGNVRKKDQTNKILNNTEGNSPNGNYDPNKLITKQERKFFIKMFPESSEQIEKHVLFTKNGQITSVVTQKGQLVDGRA